MDSNGSIAPTATKKPRMNSKDNGYPDLVIDQDIMEVDMISDENYGHFPWTNKTETIFFKCLMKHKPLGIHKNFHMLLAAHEFKTAIGMEYVDIEYLWKHVAELFCLSEMEDIEPETALGIDEVDFELPDKEFGELIRHFIDAKDTDTDRKLKDVANKKIKDLRSLSPPIAVTSAGVRRTITKSTKSINTNKATGNNFATGRSRGEKH